MEEGTRQHLTTAVENREFARSLLGDDEVSAAARRWAVVVAFYAAVHYVNAYIWERLRIEPANHEDRTTLVTTVTDLRPIQTQYLRLLSVSFDARYARRFRVTHEVAEARVHGDLDAIRAAVLNVLQP